MQTDAQRIAQLERAIRLHRDERGDDRCWLDDEVLYSILPEGYIAPERDTTVELELCKQFIQCRRNPGTTYTSPQRRIEELEAIVESLKERLLILQARNEELEQIHPMFTEEYPKES